MTTVTNLNPIPVVTGDDLLISHDTTTNRSGRISASVLKEYISDQIIADGDILASDISYRGSTVELQLDKAVKTVTSFSNIYSTLPSLNINEQFSLLGHTVNGIGGGEFIVVSSSGLTTNTGTVVVNGSKAAVRTAYTRLTPEMFGCRGAPHDDTAPLKAFVDAIKNGAPAESNGTYNYSILSGGVLSIIGTELNWVANGTTICCTAYPNSGSSAQINFVDIAVNKISLSGLTVNGGWELIANRTDGYCVTNNKFNYMHGLVLSASSGFIDNITVHDCEGLGFTAESSHGGLNNVQIGKINVHHNWMIGADFRSTGSYVSDIVIDSIKASSNGTRGGGWVGVNFGDNKSSSGTQSVIVSSIHSISNGGSGVGIGQYGNPALGDVSGADTIQVGSIVANGNVGHGVELYASKKIQIGSISTSYNDKKGVYLERSDTNNLFGYANCVQSIISSNNGQEGVVISGVNHIDIGGITSFNNGQSGSGFSGITLYAPNGLASTETGRVSIKSVDCYDDQSSKTQDYGLNLAFYGGATPYFHINSVNSYGNKLQDLFYSTYGNTKTLFIDNLKATNTTPTFADNSRVLLCVNGFMRQKWTTANSTPTAVLIARPTPGADCIVKVTAIGRTSAGDVLHIGEDTSAYKWTGTGFQKQATLQSLVHKTGLSDFYSSEFTTAIAGYVVGITSTTILWEITMWSSTGFDENFQI